MTSYVVKWKCIIFFMEPSHLQSHFPATYSMCRLSVNIFSEVLPTLPGTMYSAHKRDTISVKENKVDYSRDTGQV